MAIRLDSKTVRAGEELTGKLVGHDNPSEVEIKFVRADTHGKGQNLARSTKLTTTPSPSTGLFSLTVPPDTVPTLRGQRICVEWMLQASQGTFRRADRATVRILPNSDSQEGPHRVSYEPGTRPPMIRKLRHEHYLSMGMGASFGAMFLAAAIAINTMESKASAQETLYFTIGALVVALPPLAATYLAARTVWPKSIGGFEPMIDLPAASPGSRITVSSDDPWPNDLRFLCIETYQRTYGFGSRNSHRRTQFETFEHSEERLAADNGTVTFTIPRTAAPSFDGEYAQIRWVLRRGGRKIGRWGPIRVREWGIVVT